MTLAAHSGHGGRRHLRSPFASDKRQPEPEGHELRRQPQPSGSAQKACEEGDSGSGACSVRSRRAERPPTPIEGRRRRNSRSHSAIGKRQRSPFRRRRSFAEQREW